MICDTYDSFLTAQNEFKNKVLRKWNERSIYS